MKASALRSKSVAELQQELMSLRREQFALRLQRATGQMPKPDQFGKVRKNIARVLTLQRQARGTGVGAGVGAGFAAAASARAAQDSPTPSTARPARTRRTTTRKRGSKAKADKS